MIKGAFSLNFLHAKYTINVRKITGFGRNDCLSHPSLGWKNFNSLRLEENEPLYTDRDKYRRHFVIQSMEAGKVEAFNQFFNRENSNNFFNNTKKKESWTLTKIFQSSKS